jgi:hypothetical protein
MGCQQVPPVFILPGGDASSVWLMMACPITLTHLSSFERSGCDEMGLDSHYDGPLVRLDTGLKTDLEWD